VSRKNRLSFCRCRNAGIEQNRSHAQSRSDDCCQFPLQTSLIDWRWGEAYFALNLLDYEMASNVGNWQWAAGSGVDAAPYFRIFNPTEQIKKFDKDLKYIKKWVPELETSALSKTNCRPQRSSRKMFKVYKEAVG
jgi:deoxyribodipyrimidine photo-lyase